MKGNAVKIGFNNNINGSFLAVEVAESEQIIQYESRMLCENKIPYLIDTDMKIINDKIIFHYDINNCMSLRKRTERNELDGDDVYIVINSLVQLGKSLDDYLLTENHLILYPDLLFYRDNTDYLEFIYYPCGAGNIEEALTALSEFLIRNINHSDPNAVMLAYKFFDMVNNKDFAFDVILENYKLSSSLDVKKNNYDNALESSTINKGEVKEDIENDLDMDIADFYRYKESDIGFFSRNHFFSIIILASVLCIIAILGKIY